MPKPMDEKTKEKLRKAGLYIQDRIGWRSARASFSAFCVVNLKKKTSGDVTRSERRSFESKGGIWKSG